jgi:hypothetical protein
MLESAKDRVLGVDIKGQGVDIPGQQVSPRVRYEMTCLLIRDVVGCESCLVVWGKTQSVTLSIRCKRGSSHEETLALHAGTRVMGKP